MWSASRFAPLSKTFLPLVLAGQAVESNASDAPPTELKCTILPQASFLRPWTSYRQSSVFSAGRRRSLCHLSSRPQLSFGATPRARNDLFARQGGPHGSRDDRGG